VAIWFEVSVGDGLADVGEVVSAGAAEAVEPDELPSLAEDWIGL
jgi:hypothetical protein